MAKTREQAQAAREAKLDELHERLTGAVEQLVSGDDWRRALAFAARFRARSFSNTLLIWAQHEAAYEAGRVPEPMPSYLAGYRQWQGLGRQVQKGQPGYMIFAPVTGRFATTTPQNAESWRRLGKGEKPRTGEVVRSKMIAARPAYVWDASQTSGDLIPEPPAPRLLEGEAPAGLWDGLAALVEDRGFAVMRVPHEGMIHGANGMTDHTAETVAVRENMGRAAQVKTLAHELGHVLLHGPDTEDARQHRGIGEVEAESVALMVGAAHGMDTSGYTIPYVSTWAARVDGKEPVEIVKTTGERVRKTALTILDHLDTAQIGDGTPSGLDREAPQRDQPERGLAARERPAPEREAAGRRLPEPAARPATVAAAVRERGL
ncbi:ArdC-like ssDNA-binding domain-containing protein [Brevibacterium picturae]|uniref:Serine/arginine repetitive matrix protein 2 n=1 Tax=Brevibacterium picturae TaxID=260553 RepID=A0ABP4N2V7_9MICO